MCLKLQARRWHSYDDQTKTCLETTVQGAINRLFASLEEKFGRPFVRHSLAYLTASRHGLAETELEHLLSLDDRLLDDVFGLWQPPVRRIPPLLWTRVRAELGQYVVERSADDRPVLGWYHRQFAEVARRRFLVDRTVDDDRPLTTKDESGACCTDTEEFVRYIHRIAAEFFSGKWGGGKQKPFRYTPAQVVLFVCTKSVRRIN